MVVRDKQGGGRERLVPVGCGQRPTRVGVRNAGVRSKSDRGLQLCDTSGWRPGNIYLSYPPAGVCLGERTLRDDTGHAGGTPPASGLSPHAPGRPTPT